MSTRIVCLGATGSIGAQTLDVIARFPQHFTLVGAVAGHRTEALLAALRPVPEARAVVIDPNGPVPPAVATGTAAACELVAAADVDCVLVGGGAAAALEPTLAACAAGHRVALAAKEVLVMAGETVVAAAARGGARLIPVDSEHSAIWQCLRGEDPATVRRLILTASGGPFLTRPLETLAAVTREEALIHPQWRMGPKITVDSATLMNKGLEVIEAHFLFGVPYPAIEVAIHPQSVVHSAVEFVDGLTMAQIGVADMRGPIALALGDGLRLPGVVSPVRLTSVPTLHFEPVDPARFPALHLARQAGLRGGAAPAVLSAANEAAVQAFLEERLPFTGIVPLVAEALAAFRPPEAVTLESIRAADHWARQFVHGGLPPAPAGVGPARAPALA
ncbi:MAG TPA: 1-deoxy-D-xylulose-5-phosphate reductoisomerase [Candidatus Dormibacteraeota bacterium]|nr:1-deoxy-D-xylulose-5-phosphate reductoisomerase [Candidatus Dormibacteraeota bacterium]